MARDSALDATQVCSGEQAQLWPSSNAILAWSFRTPVKIIDWIIIAAIVGCLFLAYAGFHIEGVMLLAAVVIVASWRFWDRSCEKHLMRGASGDNCPDHPDSIADGGYDASHSGSDGGAGDD